MMNTPLPPIVHPAGYVRVAAHRGASAVEPENTLRAFRTAIEMGCDMIELDVRHTHDGIPVISHDANLQRATGHHVPINLTRLHDLRQYDVGRGERIPTLDEALDMVRAGNIEVNIEIKAPGVERAVVAAVARSGLAHRVLISSFQASVLRHMRHIAPHLPRAYLMGTQTWRPDIRLREALPLPALARVGAVAWNPHYKLVSARQVRRLRQRGLGINVWTVDDRAEMRRLLALRVDTIMTNTPDVLRALRDGEEHL